MMNYRIIFHRLTILVAIGMLVAAFVYRADAPSRPVANPPVVDLKLEIPTEKNSTQLQQERLARLQSRF
jgi:hypothetical protein